MSLLLHIADRVLNRPLMVLPEKLSLIASILDGRIGLDAAGFDPQTKLPASSPRVSRYIGQYEPVDPNNPRAGTKPFKTHNGIAIIEVLGSLVNRGSWIDAMSGITSYEKLTHQIGAAAKDPAVSAIVLDIDSPGGEAVGAFETADVVRDAAKLKDVISQANGCCCSAAYAIASAGTKVIVSKSSIVGSVGVVMLHADYSGKLHKAGIVPTLIHAGARKVDGNPYEPLSAEVTGELQAEIDAFYGLFVSSVAQGRPGMTEVNVRATEARTYIGANAVAVGLADAVGTIESVLADLANSKPLLVETARVPELMFSRADLDRARAEGHAQGMDEAVSDGGIAAAHARIAAILALPEADGRQKSAKHIAMAGQIPIATAREMLATLPLDMDALRAGGTQLGLVIDNSR